MPKFSIDLQDKQYEAREYILQPDRAQYIFYGGAKGGGKSYLSRAVLIDDCMTYAGISAVIIRKTFPELSANHIRKLFQEYPFVRKWYRASEKIIYFPNGSTLELKHLANTDDVYNYQGIEYDIIDLDEATQHEEDVFKILKTSLRSDPKIRAKHPTFRPYFLLTGNPGGIGHGWCKRLFVDRDFRDNEKPDDYHFIQAKIYDNPLFLQANPEYLNNLRDLSDELQRAYLDGDWTVFMGQYFKDWRDDVHVIDPFEIPEDWSRLFSVDWGYSPHPFHVGFYALDDVSGTIFKYMELQGTETSPQDVAEMIAQVALGGQAEGSDQFILEMNSNGGGDVSGAGVPTGVGDTFNQHSQVGGIQKSQNLIYGVGDTQMWELNPFQSLSEVRADYMYSDKSIALQINDVLAKYGMSMQQAVKSRITGWTNLKTLLKWKGDVDSDGKRVITKTPKYYVFNSCEHTIKAYPRMIHNDLKPEDMLKMNGDDPCDCDRYAIMALNEKVQYEPSNYVTKWQKAREKEYRTFERDAAQRGLILQEPIRQNRWETLY